MGFKNITTLHVWITTSPQVRFVMFIWWFCTYTQ